jgi:hypothetical protein
VRACNVMSGDAFARRKSTLCVDFPVENTRPKRTYGGFHAGRIPGKKNTRRCMP